MQLVVKKQCKLNSHKKMYVIRSFLSTKGRIYLAFSIRLMFLFRVFFSSFVQRKLEQVRNELPHETPV